MEIKIVKEYTDTGLGFPVHIRNAELIKVRGTWALKIDHNKLNTMVALALSTGNSRLTGNQLKFIRYFFKMTLKDFGERFGVSHSTVVSWEKKGNSSTRMEWGTEKDIRLEVFSRVYRKPVKVGVLFTELNHKPTLSSNELDLDLAS